MLMECLVEISPVFSLESWLTKQPLQICFVVIKLASPTPFVEIVDYVVSPPIVVSSWPLFEAIRMCEYHLPL